MDDVGMMEMFQQITLHGANNTMPDFHGLTMNAGTHLHDTSAAPWVNFSTKKLVLTLRLDRSSLGGLAHGRQHARAIKRGRSSCLAAFPCTCDVFSATQIISHSQLARHVSLTSQTTSALQTIMLLSLCVYSSILARVSHTDAPLQKKRTKCSK
jgi:hypothetical protein